MRKTAILVIMIIIMTLLVACGSANPAPSNQSPELQPLPSPAPSQEPDRDDSYIISVTGSQTSPVIEFSGNYMVVESSGVSSSRSVDGYTPAEYRVKGIIVSCVFQKTGEKGLLKVEILKGGKVVKSAHTTAAYGMVSVATS